MWRFRTATIIASHKIGPKIWLSPSKIQACFDQETINGLKTSLNTQIQTKTSLTVYSHAIKIHKSLVFMPIVCRIYKSQHFLLMGAHRQYLHPTKETIHHGLQPCNEDTQQRPLYKHLYLCSLYAVYPNPNISHQWAFTTNTHIQPETIDGFLVYRFS